MALLAGGAFSGVRGRSSSSGYEEGGVILSLESFKGEMLALLSV
jgi:hypothetical protein